MLYMISILCQGESSLQHIEDWARNAQAENAENLLEGELTRSAISIPIPIASRLYRDFFPIYINGIKFCCDQFRCSLVSHERPTFTFLNALATYKPPPSYSYKTFTPNKEYCSCK